MILSVVAVLLLVFFVVLGTRVGDDEDEESEACDGADELKERYSVMISDRCVRM